MLSEKKNDQTPEKCERKKDTTIILQSFLCIFLVHTQEPKPQHENAKTPVVPPPQNACYLIIYEYIVDFINVVGCKKMLISAILFLFLHLFLQPHHITSHFSLSIPCS